MDSKNLIMRHDTLIQVNDGNPPFITPKKSWWRVWNQLSRLQRNIISMFMFLVMLSVIYYSLAHNSSTPSYTSESAGVQLKIDDVENVESTFSTIPPVPIHMLEKRIHRPSSSSSKPLIEVKKRKQLPPPKLKNEERSPMIFPLPSNPRQQAVVDAFKHAWTGYKEFAWGHDHLKPISKHYHDWFGLGLTLVDSLDTMYIMGLKKEFNEAKDWVQNFLKLNEYNDVNLFEVTIRVLGGLLSAYHLSADSVFLDKAKELGERLFPSFTKSPSAVPYSDVNLGSLVVHSPRWGPDSSTSEVTTLQLEFRDLSRSCKDPKFETAAARVSEHVHTLPKTDGLVPVFINPKTGQFQPYSDIKLGARGDSYYEYLVKQWIQTGKSIDYLRDDYLEAVRGIESNLIKQTAIKKLYFIGELKGGTHDFIPKMDHLVCYFPGTLALGYHHGLPKTHMDLAEKLMETCYLTYSERPTFLAPEITYFSVEDEGLGDMHVKSNDAHNLLRPEFIESLWYFYQITGNKTYQDWGWNIFQAFEKYTKVPHGYTSIGNVNAPNDTRPRDMMESFFLSETLKYFYLLFADDRYLMHIDKFVMNSEGHPLPIYDS